MALALSLLALAQAYELPQPLVVPLTSRVYATLGNPTYLAAILMMTTLVAVGFLAGSFLPRAKRTAPPSGAGARRGMREIRRRGRWSSGPARWPPRLRRLFWGATVLLGIWTMFLTGSRGPLIGLIAGAISMPAVLAVCGNRSALRAVSLAAAGLVLLTASFFAADQWVGLSIRSQTETASHRFLNTGLDPGDVAIRWKLIGVGVRAFAERPLLGWGQDNFARAFDKHADASFYEYGRTHHDQAHNKPVEELATKGALGLLAYGAAWAALAWAIVRKMRRRREEVLAYAILGALAGYWVQNLFLFDTPAMMLQWTLLLSWVAGQERPAPTEKGNSDEA